MLDYDLKSKLRDIISNTLLYGKNTSNKQAEGIHNYEYLPPVYVVFNIFRLILTI